MPKQPTKLAVQQPLTEADSTAAQHFRTWLNEVSAYMPIVGSGSPEGVVEARQYALYIDETSPQLPVKYFKMLAEVGGDRSRGWVSAAKLSALTVSGDATVTGGITADSLTVTDVYRNVASGEGDKFGTPSTSDFGWADMTAPINVRGVAATDPAWTQISTGPLYAYAFGVGDYVWQPFHVPHDIVPGSDIHFHVHWLPSGTDNNIVKWQFDYAYAKGFNQEAFDPTCETVTAEDFGPGVAYQHMVTESDAVTIPGLTEPDGIIYVRFGRVTNGGTNNTDTIFVLTADIHYQSTGMPATKNKSPNFYT